MVRQSYGGVAVALHWFVVLLLVLAYPLALWMGDLPKGAEKAQVLVWHQSVGFLVLAVTVLRLGWRKLYGAPTHDMTTAIGKLAVLVQITLYVLTLAVPVLGWMTLSAGGHPVTFLNILSLPNVMTKNHDLHEQLGDIHQFLAYSMLGLIALHVAGALKHHFVMRDEVLQRMAPWVPSRKNR